MNLQNAQSSSPCTKVLYVRTFLISVRLPNYSISSFGEEENWRRSARAFLFPMCIMLPWMAVCLPSFLPKWSSECQPSLNACLPTVGGKLLLANTRGAELPAESSQCPCSFRRQNESLKDTHCMLTLINMHLHSRRHTNMSTSAQSTHLENV